MTEEEKEERKRIFEVYRDEINKRQLSNSESFDKAMLSLSSAGLALSLSFIKFIVPLDKIEHTFFLYSTWWFFGITIILTILSLLISQKALEKTLKYAGEYYLPPYNEASLNKSDNWIKATDWFNKIPAATFILAIFSVIIFSTQNFQIQEKASTMSKKVNTERGASVPNMQKLPTKDTYTNGTNIPKMQPTQPVEKSKSNITKEK